MKRTIFSVVFFVLTNIYAYSQPAKELIEVIVRPDAVDWTYKKGDRTEFEITVLRNNIPMNGIEVQYRIEPEKIEPLKEGTLKMEKNSVSVKAPEFKDAGFLRCYASVNVNGIIYSSYATAGFSPDEIEPTTTLPDDFKEFWDKGKKELAEVPVNAVMRIMPERCTDKVDVYHVSINNIKGKIYGILCKPKKEGRYPAILHVPGAGIRPYYGDVANAEKGIVTLQIGIHGIPVNLDPVVYEDLRSGALDGYWISNLDDKNRYYFKRVYLGCVRAVDFIETLDFYNGEDIAVTGGSQGGALSIIAAALDERIDYLAALYPALSDLTGYLYDRAGGWPHMFRDDFTNKQKKIEISKYFDVVNFARFVKVPGWYSWGYNDNTCPPTSMHSAYNVIDAPKELHLFQETQHWTFPEQQEMRNNWLLENLLK
jgi:cephalosporin-C deacetylase